jgi:hypothetical protein
MHRSGTSAAARVVNLLGVPLGDAADRMPPDPSNPAGHWESASLSAWNDQVLEALGGSWVAPPVIDNGVWTTTRIKQLRRQALARFRTVHATESWVWKDPRNCLTLPFWRPVLSPRPTVLLVFRDPLEVAASLSTRNGCSPLYGLALWERYLRAALRNAEGLPIFVLGYAQLLADPGGVAERLREFLGGAGVAPDADRLDAIRGFIDQTLRRARAEPDGIAMSPAQAELARRIEALAGPHERLAAPELPDETPHTEAMLDAKREPERRAREFERDLRQLEARTREVDRFAEARAAELARARPYASELEARLAQQGEELERAGTYARELEGRLARQGEELKRAAAYARELEQRLALQGDELARAAPYARELESRLAQHDAELAELRALAEGQAEALGLRMAEMEALGAALAERSALAARHLLESRNQRAELDRLGKWIDELGQRNDALGGQHNDLGRQHEALNRQHEELGTRNEALRAKVAELEQRNRALNERSWTVAARSVLIRGLPLGSRRRAACEALLGTLAAMRRSR